MGALPVSKDAILAAYLAFLQAKMQTAPEKGFPCEESEVNPILLPHQRAAVCWAVRGGRRLLAESFGLGKSIQQLEIVRITLRKLAELGSFGPLRGIIVLPLGVRQEFTRDAANLLGIPVCFIRQTEEVGGDGIYLTNYESIRDRKLDPHLFKVMSCDEAARFRGFGGSETFRVFMATCAGEEKNYGGKVITSGVPYRFLATATPAPNNYIELLCYAAFLGIMDVSAAKTRFFKRDSTKADNLTLHPHKEREFWLWVSSWAFFLQSPADLGFDATGYELPPLEVVWHEIPSEVLTADGQWAGGKERWGQVRLLKNTACGVTDAAREKKSSLAARVAKMLEILAQSPEDHCILWHDLEAERHAIQAALPEAVSVYGTQDLDERERRIIAFSEGQSKYLSTKPVVAGAGCNFQRFCHRAIFTGIGFKFNDFIQAVHRIQRFQQPQPVRIDLIYTEAEREVKAVLMRKWEQYKKLTGKMTEIIKEYGLAKVALLTALERSIGVERVEVSGRNHRLTNNDTVIETRGMEADSIGLILTSIPFSTQYEYTPSFNDFGHTDSNAHFWQQMDFLIPQLLRVLSPGRVAAIHVKDRIVPGGLTGLGFQTVYPFHADAIREFQKHGFAFLGMKTIVTDVVRENNQTYRLGWTEQCKDGSRMGVGMPEYLLLFRKPPTDLSDGYADLPVVKEKPMVRTDDGEIIPFDDPRNPKKDLPIVPGTGYSRARWQTDAHGYSRSSGDRLITPEELEMLDHGQIFRLFRHHSLHQVYNFEHDVRVGETLEMRGQLPVTFMLLQPQSWHPDVWTDITRMLTLNGAQSAAGREMHLCALQIDLVDRVITQFSNEGETVYDCFSGLGTVPYRAIKLRRKGIGVELNARYFYDACAYCRAAEEEVSMPSLFDMDALEVENGKAPNTLSDLAATLNTGANPAYPRTPGGGKGENRRGGRKSGHLPGSAQKADSDGTAQDAPGGGRSAESSRQPAGLTEVAT